MKNYLFSTLPASLKKARFKFRKLRLLAAAPENGMFELFVFRLKIAYVFFNKNQREVEETQKKNIYRQPETTCFAHMYGRKDFNGSP